ncbi:hypothetical protein EIN_141620, partial [Entamoeba invadens IP1]
VQLVNISIQKLAPVAQKTLIPCKTVRLVQTVLLVIIVLLGRMVMALNALPAKQVHFQVYQEVPVACHVFINLIRIQLLQFHVQNATIIALRVMGENGFCSTCMDGCVLSGNYCIPCQAGTATNKDTNTCDVCPAGTYSLNQSTTCLHCQDGFYSTEKSSICLQCNVNCLICNNTNGNCTTCISGYGLDELSNCHICPVGTYANSANNKCQQCGDKTYQPNEGQTYCISCDINCETCGSVSGKCLTCYAGYGLDNNGKCEQCSDGYYSPGKTSSCSSCPIECVNCYRESGECTTCQSGFKKVTNQNTGNEECVSCSLNDHCASCNVNANESERTCVECLSGYYLKHNNCYNCSLITNCVQCSQKSSECLSCSSDLISNGEKCISCKYGEVKVTSNMCAFCYELIPNCQFCEYNNGSQLCAKCYAPYVLSDKKSMCVLAFLNLTYYNYDTSKSDVNDVGCLRQVNSSCLLW